MHDPRLSLAIVLGSTRPGRFCETIAAWVLSRVELEPDFEISVVDPAMASEPGQQATSVHARNVTVIDRADAVIVVVPEYNHGYPAPLKALIDAIRLPWRAKPVAFVSYGGISGGIRAVEQLRQVFAELHSVAIRNSVSFSHATQQFDPDGRLRDPLPAQEAMDVLIVQLRWWAQALRKARESAPYPQAA